MELNSNKLVMITTIVIALFSSATAFSAAERSSRFNLLSRAANANEKESSRLGNFEGNVSLTPISPLPQERSINPSLKTIVFLPLIPKLKNNAGSVSKEEIATDTSVGFDTHSSDVASEIHSLYKQPEPNVQLNSAIAEVAEGGKCNVFDKTSRESGENINNLEQDEKAPENAPNFETPFEYFSPTVCENVPSAFDNMTRLKDSLSENGKEKAAEKSEDNPQLEIPYVFARMQFQKDSKNERKPDSEYGSGQRATSTQVQSLQTYKKQPKLGESGLGINSRNQEHYDNNENFESKPPDTSPKIDTLITVVFPQIAKDKTNSANIDIFRILNFMISIGVIYFTFAILRRKRTVTDVRTPANLNRVAAQPGYDRKRIQGYGEAAAILLIISFINLEVSAGKYIYFNNEDERNVQSLP